MGLFDDAAIMPTVGTNPRKAPVGYACKRVRESSNRDEMILKFPLTTKIEVCSGLAQYGVVESRIHPIR